MTQTNLNKVGAGDGHGTAKLLEHLGWSEIDASPLAIHIMDFRYAGGEGMDDTTVSQQSRGRVGIEHPPAAIVEAERATNSTDND